MIISPNSDSLHVSNNGQKATIYQQVRCYLERNDELSQDEIIRQADTEAFYDIFGVEGAEYEDVEYKIWSVTPPPGAPTELALVVSIRFSVKKSNLSLNQANWVDRYIRPVPLVTYPKCEPWNFMIKDCSEPTYKTTIGESTNA